MLGERRFCLISLTDMLIKVESDRQTFARNPIHIGLKQDALLPVFLNSAVE